MRVVLLCDGGDNGRVCCSVHHGDVVGLTVVTMGHCYYLEDDGEL